jgi:hypothetical protein
MGGFGFKHAEVTSPARGILVDDQLTLLFEITTNTVSSN